MQPSETNTGLDSVFISEMLGRVLGMKNTGQRKRGGFHLQPLEILVVGGTGLEPVAFGL